MQPLTASDVVALWERGSPSHPLDRALLLAAVARPDLPADALADLTVGERNAVLISLRRATFGPEIRAYVDCPRCRERMQVTLDTDMFLAHAGSAGVAEFDAGGFRFRPPTSRDLASLLSCADDETAAVRLLQRCCVAAPPDRALPAADALDSIGAGVESIDPCASIELTMLCQGCAHAWAAPFDIAAIVWDEIEARARALLSTVHALATAYGWRESDILALGEERRAAYLAMVTA